MKLGDFQLEIEEKILEYILDNKFRHEIEEAKNSFYDQQKQGSINTPLNLDFNSWLIYDYKMEDGKTFFESYYINNHKYLSEQQERIMEKVIRSFASLYELKELKKNKGLFKDVFRKTESWISGNHLNQIAVKDLVFSRIIKVNDEFKFFGGKIYLPGFLRNSIERNIISHYEEYKSRNQYVSWDNFLDENRLLLYKYIGIAADVINHDVEEDEEKYHVWQSAYLIKDARNVKDILLKHSFIQFDMEDSGSTYFKITEKGRHLAELVLSNNRCELECTSEKDREKAKKIFESVLNDLVVHYKDEVIGIDDII